MDIISYRNKTTIKSEVLKRINIEIIPDYISEYEILKDSVIYQKEDVIVLKCIGKKREENIIKISCLYNEQIVNKIYDNKNIYIMPIISKGYIQGGMWYQIFPFYQQGNIGQHLDYFNLESLMQLVNEMNEALHYLHNIIGIVHMDIKLDNIYYYDGHYVLGDFDTAVVCKQLNEENERVLSANKYKEQNSTLFGLPEYDYALLGEMIKEIVSLRDDLKNYDIRNIIAGLTNETIDNRWTYEEINDICSGKFIESGWKSKSQKLVKKNEVKPFIFGVDNNTVLYACSLEELGVLIKKYRNIALMRHIKNKSGWNAFVEFINLFDKEIGSDVNELLHSKNSEEALDDISKLLSYDSNLYYRGVAGNLLDIVNKLPRDKYDEEFIDLAKSPTFRTYLDEKYHTNEKNAINKILAVSSGNDILFYYLVLFYIGKDDSFEKEMIGNVDGMSYEDRIIRMRDKLCTNSELFSTKLYQLEAWLTINKCEESIIKIREVSNKYEQ